MTTPGQDDGRRRLLTAVAGADTATRALGDAVGVIAEVAGWAVARALTVGDGGRLQSAGWFLSDPARFEAFRAVSEASDPDAGAPGRALRSGEAWWCDDLAAEPAFLRRQAAAVCGLQAGAFLPVAGDSGALALVEVYALAADDVRDLHRRLRTLELIGDLVPALQRRRQGEELGLRDDRFRAVFDGPVGMVLLDGAMRVVEANAAVGLMLGSRPADLHGLPFDSLPGLSAGAALADLRRRLEAHGEAALQLELGGGDGGAVSIRAWRVADEGRFGFAASFDPHPEHRRAAELAADRSARRRAAVALLRTITDEPRLVSAVAECVRSMVDASYGGVALSASDGTPLHAVTVAGLADPAASTLPVPQGILSAFVLEDRPLRLADVRTHPASAGAPSEGPQATSFLGVPLMAASTTLGHLVALDRTDGQPFDETDEVVLLDLAAAAASAILRVRSVAQSRAAVGALQRLVASNLELLRQARPEVLPRAAVDMARTVTDAEQSALIVVDPASGEVGAFVHSGMAPATAARIGDAPSARGLLGAAMAAGRPTRLADLRHHPAHRGFPAHHPVMRSFLGVPISGRAGTVGLLFCTDKRSGPGFTQSDEDAARRIAETIGEALDTAPGQGDAILQQLSATSERIRADEEARWRFLGSLSHELRGSIAGIIMSAELLSDAGLVPLQEEQGRQLSGRIVTVARNLMTLLDNLLDLSRVQSGRLEVRMQPLDVLPVIADLVTELDIPITEAELLVDHPSDVLVPRVLADPVRLRQVLFNLLTNAIKFTPRRGHVWLELTSTEHDVTIAVCDSGVGIAESDLERLFQPFERAAGLETPGTGLGLAIARAIMELHGGRLEATSWPGVGSRFAATFRVARGPHLTRAFDEAIEEHGQLAGAGGGGRILLVEDDATSRETTLAVLRTAGYAVEAATTCAEALTLAEATVPELVLLDVQLPDGNGLDLVERLRAMAAPRTLPIVAFTADRMGDTEERAEQLCDDYILKPVLPRELLRRLRMALEEAAGARPA